MLTILKLKNKTPVTLLDEQKQEMYASSYASEITKQRIRVVQFVWRMRNTYFNVWQGVGGILWKHDEKCNCCVWDGLWTFI